MSKGSQKKRGAWGIRTSSFHLIDPLTNELPYDEETLITEALKRGADVLTLFRLLRESRRGHRNSSTDSMAYFGGVKTMIFDTEPFFHSELSQEADARLIQTQVHRYEEEIRREFDSLPGHVRAAFGEGSGRKRPKDAGARAQFEADEDALHFLYYKGMRWRYYNAGYSDPANQFLNQIVEGEGAKILGHRIGAGLHPKYIEQVKPLEKTLEGSQKGLAKQVGDSITSIEGFQPRTIAGRPTVSNHAYGLAIDVDARWNPHVKSPKTIAVLKEVTGYDFGAFDTAVLEALTLASSARHDVLSRTQKRMQEASNKFRDWLRAVLSRPTPATSSAVQNIDDVRMQELLKENKMADLRRWADCGIQTIPLAFAAAMGDLGFRWGEEYKSSKDNMHFELLAQKVLPPDSAPRTVAELFPAGLNQTFEL